MGFRCVAFTNELPNQLGQPDLLNGEYFEDLGL